MATSATSRTRSRKPRSKADPATAYAQGVVSGEIVAGRYQRLACQRHLDDLERTDYLEWRPELLAGVRLFFETHMTVESPDGTGAIPFRLHPFQEFLLGNLFCWLLKEGNPWDRPPGSRRFREAYVETARGSGKTRLSSGIILYHMVAPGHHHSPEGYVLTPSREQSAIALSDLDDAIKGSEALKADGWRCNIGRDVARAENKSRKATIDTAVTVSPNAAIGKRPTIVFADEVQLHGESKAGANLRQGFKLIRNPLVLSMTNAGGWRAGEGWKQRQEMVRILNGKNIEPEDDGKFAVICCADGDDPDTGDQREWHKANPCIGTTMHLTNLIDRHSEARRSEEAMRDFKRFILGVWPVVGASWIADRDWRKRQVEELPGDRAPDCPLYLGLDLAEVSDMTALALVFDDGSGIYQCKVEQFAPEDTLDERSEQWGAYLREWAEQGYLQTTPGGVIDFAYPARRIRDLSERYNVRGLAYDRHLFRQFKEKMEQQGLVLYEGMPVEGRDGIACIDHPQSGAGSKSSDFRMFASHKLFKDLLLTDTETTGKGVVIARNPVLDWNANGATEKYMGETGEKYLSKRDSRHQNNALIDGLIALEMAVALADAMHRPRRDVSEDTLKALAEASF